MIKMNVINVVLADMGYPEAFAEICGVPGCDCGEVIISTDSPFTHPLPPLVLYKAFWVAGSTSHCFTCFTLNQDRGFNSSSPLVTCPPEHDRGQWVRWDS